MGVGGWFDGEGRALPKWAMRRPLSSSTSRSRSTTKARFIPVEFREIRSKNRSKIRVTRINFRLESRKFIRVTDVIRWHIAAPPLETVCSDTPIFYMERSRASSESSLHSRELSRVETRLEQHALRTISRIREMDWTPQSTLTVTLSHVLT